MCVHVTMPTLAEYAKHEEEKNSRSELDAIPTLIDYAKPEDEMDPKSVLITGSRKGKFFV